MNQQNEKISPTEQPLAQMPECFAYHSEHGDANCRGNCNRRKGHDDQHKCGKCGEWFSD